jgi:DNA-binding transcriptional MerR regulator
MYTMKDVCRETGMRYETLKFYCNEGLIPNVKRNTSNYRVFDDRDVAWIKSLSCLKNCGMSIQEMKEYIKLCLEGEPSIPDRKQILSKKREELLEKMEALQESVDYIDAKQSFYDGVLSGKIKYHSNLLPLHEEDT